VKEKGLSYLIVGPFAIILAFPFYVMVITAFKNRTELYDPSITPYWFGKQSPTWDNASYLFHETQYPRWLANTAIVGVCVVAVTLVLAVPAGYALARLAGRVGQSLGVGIFLTYLVPPTLLFIPLFWVINQVHLQNSIWSLVLVYPSFTVPFATWLLMGFFKTIPAELEDAARVRCVAADDPDACRLPDLRPRNPHCRDLLVLARRERVRVRLHVHLAIRPQDGLDRCLYGSHPWRPA
jgi:multiple sugar transport system permease protein